MIPIPKPEDYDVSVVNGFLPNEPPIERLSDAYYEPWEYVMKNLQGLILSKRLREVVEKLPVLSTEYLADEPQWRRAYSVLAFIAHAYIWVGDRPCERVPAPITKPFTQICNRLQLPTVATYAGLVLWNWKPIFDSERPDTLANLDTIDTFTGSLDEKWFYLISIAVEVRAGPLIPLMLRAIEAAQDGNRAVVTECLKTFAESLDDIGSLLVRMYDQCDPHVFYHRIRPFFNGGKNMAQAGLPNGVIFDNGGPMNKQRYVQYSGGSNAQSSIIQFFDIVLGVVHRPTGQTKDNTAISEQAKKPAHCSESFIKDMRKYMPGPHARFLEQVDRVANIRSFVEYHFYDRALGLAFDSCLAMLSALRDKHMQIVSRYIIVKSRQAKAKEGEPKHAEKEQKISLAHRTKPTSTEGEKKDQTGTGGTSLIQFLRQARDETGEPAVDAWTRQLLNKKNGRRASEGECEVKPGLAGVWKVDIGGGLCLT